MDFFQRTCGKEHSNMAFTKTSEQRNIFVNNNVFQLSHGVKAFVEASCIDNIHTGEKVILQLFILKICEFFLFRESKTL